MQVRAQLNYLRMSPRKVRLVADLVRGRTVSDARAQLAATVRGATAPLRKLLTSAVANAKHGFSLDEANLYIAEIRVDGGPTLKRSRPRSRGMTHPIGKRTSHVTIVLGERIPTRRRAAPSAAAAATQPGADVALADVPAAERPGRERRTLREVTRDGEPAPPRRRIGDLGRRIFRRKAI